MPSTAGSPGKSAPIAPPLANATPLPADTPYPGVMTLAVDATDIERGIFRVKQSIPFAGPGPMTLLYPEWLPGKHAPRGAISELAGLTVSADGKPVRWTRDPLDVYAFRLDVPDGADMLTVSFEFLSPVRAAEGRIVMTPAMLNVQWEQVSLYPAGHYARRIRVRPSITLPKDWVGIAALDGAETNRGTIRYGETDYETLIDSPMFAGPHYRKWDLGHNVSLNVWADEAKFLEAKPEHIAAHRALVSEAVALFGSKPFDRYEFLLGLTDELGGIGLEHHRSSENTRAEDYFTKWEENGWERGLLPHELVHSWNGKYRRPAGLWTPDYRTPMQTNLLWVYEGQTSYWDLVLGARSGLQTTDMVLGEWARAAANYALQPGRQWRSVEDTAFDPITAARKPKPFASWQRREDYYVEGSLVWLEADMTIRELTRGKRSLDDFARSFFGGRDGDWGQRTFDFGEVVAALNAVAPYDWANFLDQRIRTPGQAPPLAGFEKGGYTLIYREEPNIHDRQREAGTNSLDLSFSLGLTLDKDGVVSDVIWNGIAFAADIVNGAKIVAVNGRDYSNERMKEAITLAKTSGTLDLLIARGGRYRSVTLNYKDGLRYPHLVKNGNSEGLIDRLLKPISG